MILSLLACVTSQTTAVATPTGPSLPARPEDIPVEPLDGLPVGMQVIGRHHEDALLLDLAAVVERECPWPLVAPGAPV